MLTSGLRLVASWVALGVSPRGWGDRLRTGVVGSQLPSREPVGEASLSVSWVATGPPQSTPARRASTENARGHQEAQEKQKGASLTLNASSEGSVADRPRPSLALL